MNRDPRTGRPYEPNRTHRAVQDRPVQTDLTNAISNVVVVGVFLIFLIFIIAAWNNISSSVSGGGGGNGTMNWSDTVQGQYCSDPGNLAAAKGLAEGNGASLNDVCTKMWAVDKHLNQSTFDPTAPYDPFAP